MSVQVFTEPDQLLHHILGELDHLPDMATRNISGKQLDMAEVVRGFYAETFPPQGRMQFLRYCIAWLHNDWMADEVCSTPSDVEYQQAWGDLRQYRTCHWETKRRFLTCLARFGEHLLMRGIFATTTRSYSAPASTGSDQPKSSALQGECLARDGNRCVVTGAFNRTEGPRRHPTYLDDDNLPLSNDPRGFANLEVAHIIPHVLGWRDDVKQDSIQPRMNSHIILDMFRPRTMAKYEASAIDRCENAITLSRDTRPMFGAREIYFEPNQDGQSYTVHYVAEPTIFAPEYPRNVTLRSVTDIALPDSDLLAIRRACARIAHATGADEASLRFFRDLDEGTVETDGSTPLDHLVAFQLQFSRHRGFEPQCTAFGEKDNRLWGRK